MIKAVMFDLDDTLLRSVKAKWDHHKAVGREVYGVEVTDAALREHWGKPISVLVDELYQHADTVENMLARNRELDHRFPKGVFNDALGTVEGLITDGMLVGVVTSTMTEWARRDLIRHGFRVDEFVILQGEDIHHAHKPDPEVFAPAFKVLAGRGVIPSEVVYIGDSLLDYAAARDAGMQFIGVTTGLVDATEFATAGALHTGASLTEVVSLIDSA